MRGTSNHKSPCLSKAGNVGKMFFQDAKFYCNIIHGCLLSTSICLVLMLHFWMCLSIWGTYVTVHCSSIQSWNMSNSKNAEKLAQDTNIFWGKVVFWGRDLRGICRRWKISVRVKRFREMRPEDNISHVIERTQRRRFQKSQQVLKDCGNYIILRYFRGCEG